MRRRGYSRKSKSCLGVISRTSQSLKITSKETPTLPSSMVATSSIRTNADSTIYKAHTLNVKSVRKTSKITIINKSNDPLEITITNRSGCSVSRKTVTLYGLRWADADDNKVTIKVYTYYGKNGTFDLELNSPSGTDLYYTVTDSGFTSFFRLK